MSTRKKPKNLLLIHLESISNTILWQYRVELGTVWRLMQSSRRFTRFYSNATSTIMAKYGMWDGASDRWDCLPHYAMTLPPETLGRWNRARLMNCLIDNGEYLSHTHQINYYNPPSEHHRQETWNTHSKEQYVAGFYEHVMQARKENKPFCAYLLNLIPHMAMDDELKREAKTFSERFRQGYLAMDATLNQILSIMAQLNLWDDTLVVGFGDHGDEMWSHGLNRGYSHGIAPYASLCWTPCFIFENGKDEGDDDRLVSMIDLKNMILERLLGDTVPPENLAKYQVGAFPGVNAEKEKRELAFSHNLFALQLEYEDPEQGMTKNYAVTDGVYRLVVASGGKRPKDGGLEFYYDRLDPSNSRNLLDFFRLGSTGDIIGFAPPPEATDVDFALAFNEETVRHMTETYQKLKAELYQYVRAKEGEAKKTRYAESHTMPESAFHHARKRLRRDYDE